MCLNPVDIHEKYVDAIEAYTSICELGKASLPFLSDSGAAVRTILDTLRPGGISSMGLRTGSALCGALRRDSVTFLYSFQQEAGQCR